MIAGALDDGVSAGVAHRKALASDAAEIGFPGDCTVEHRVAGDDVQTRFATELRRRLDDDAAPGQAFAAVVVGIADQVQRDAA